MVSSRMLASVALALVCACGSTSGSDAGTGPSGDDAPPFVGTWTGVLSLTDATSGSVIQSGQTSFPIAELAANSIGLQDACPDESAITASVTSATQFVISTAFACPAVSVTGCTSVVVTFETLTGTLTNSSLSMTGSISEVGCGQTVNANLSFGPATKG